MSDYAPIALLVYKRLDLTIQAIESLKRNNLAQFSPLYIFSDAAKSETAEKQVNEVREYISSIDGFAEVTVIMASKNLGSANSPISGVNKVLEKYERIIVVEDDLIVSTNFLDYMNAALDYYADIGNIGSICGYGLALHFNENDKADVYFLPRGGAWGWATWKNRWEKIDWEVSDYETFKNDKVARKKFNIGGADMSRMLDHQMNGKIDAWDIRRCYSQHKLGMLSVYPKVSKIENNGFGQNATHTVNNPNFKITFDTSNKTLFNFSDKVEINEDLLDQFTYFFSISYRIKNRLRNYIYKFLKPPK